MQPTSNEPDALWAAANSAYNTGEWDKALANYKIIADKGLESAALYYNMANTYFKKGDIAHSILFYHRALRLAPADEDIRHNLEYAEQSTRDIIEQIPEFFLTSWMRTVRNTMSGNAWTLLSLALLAMTFVAGIIYLLAQRLRLRKLGFYVMAACGILFIASTSFAISSRSEMVSGKEAVVMSSSVSIKSSPDRAATELFVLHEGTTVKVGEKIDGWVEIRIADGRKGWIEESRIERI
jgi:tetratricopeptide (TPR) repeat protein